MKDSHNHSDSSAMVFVLMIGIVAAVGFSSAQSSLAAKDAAIAALQSQVTELKGSLTQCRSEFQGFKDGRR